jgi:hypothetical protein
MAILTECPVCSRTVRVPDHLLGQLVQCPTCGQRFITAEGSGGSETKEMLSGEEALERDDRDRATLPAGDDYQDDPGYSDHAPIDSGNGKPWPRALTEKPPKVQAIGIMMLIGGIVALLISGVGTLGSAFICCVWPGTYYGGVLGIMAIVKGAQLLGEQAYLQSLPRGIAIMQIINIVNGDVPNCVMGILALVFLNEPEVRHYFRR